MPRFQRFSPITNRSEFEAACAYVSEQVSALTTLLSGLVLPVPIVKVFAQYPDEFETIAQFVKAHGPTSAAASDMSYYVDVESGFALSGTPIELLGVRRADPYRLQVGCGDSYVDDFDAVQASLTAAHPDFVRTVDNEHGHEMIELWHPDYDVLTYLLPR